MDNESEAAQIVGRIRNLSNVNGNTVSCFFFIKHLILIVVFLQLTNRERVDLERYYIKLCTKDGSTHEEIAAIHPRYSELCTGNINDSQDTLSNA